MKNNGEKVIIGDEYLIYIACNNAVNVEYKMIGMYNNVLKIDYDIDNNSIVAVYCILANIIDEISYEMPQCSQLKKIDTPKFNSDFSRKNFRIFYDDIRANILFTDIDNISSYYRDGRVDYYYDDNAELCAITINDLTKDEYQTLYNEDYIGLGTYLNKNLDNKEDNTKNR